VKDTDPPSYGDRQKIADLDHAAAQLKIALRRCMGDQYTEGFSVNIDSMVESVCRLKWIQR
jgi:hypothetical protein